MSERVGLDMSKVASKVCVSIGPDGRILSHETLSPPERKIQPFQIVQAIANLKNNPKEEENIKKRVSTEGNLILWLSSDSRTIYVVEDKSC